MPDLSSSSVPPPRRVLAIETTSPRGSIAVVEGTKTLFHQVFMAERSHNSALFEPLGEALKFLEKGRFGEGETRRRGDADRVKLPVPKSPSPQVSYIVAGTGPGSYVGARIAIATIEALSLALEVPALGWSSLAALVDENNVPIQGHYAVLGDARRDCFFAAEVVNGKLQSLPVPQSWSDFLEWLQNNELLAKYVLEPLHEIDGLELNQRINLAYPDAAVLASRIAQFDETELNEVKEQVLEPVYLRAPFTTLPKKRGLV